MREGRGWLAGLGVAAMVLLLVGALIVAREAERRGLDRPPPGSALAARPL
jgi:hypothetical protein